MGWLLVVLAGAAFPSAAPPAPLPEARAAAPAAARVAAGTPAPLPHDKRLHLLAGWLAGGAGYAAGVEAEVSTGDRRRVAAGLALAAGVGKEAFDAVVQDEPFSWGDLGATALGAALFLGVAALAAP